MKNLLTFLCTSFLVSAALLVTFPSFTRADGGVGGGIAGGVASGVNQPAGNQPACQVDPNSHGVLVQHTYTSGGFPCYLNDFLHQNMIYVILIAIVLIVWSGIEYMLAGAGLGTPADKDGKGGSIKKAKARIVSVLSGVVFYFLITYIAKLLASGLTIG